MAKLYVDQAETLRASGYFDEPWYLDTYPDVRRVNIDAAEHFLRIGVRIGRNPSPTCSNAQYLDVVAMGDWGQPVPADDQAATEQVPPQGHDERASRWDLEALVANTYFDRDLYRRRYPELAVEPFDPYWHFKTFGFDEGRIGSFFDANWYSARYENIGVTGAEAFEHYKNFGADEEREARYVNITQAKRPG